LEKDSRRDIFQVCWGIALLFAGVAVILYTPQKIEQIKKLTDSTAFIRFSFYFLGVMLIGGGIKKIYKNYRQLSDSQKEE
jgi:hypothetical protein